ncbi:hypothetical protein SGO26_09420 [Cupriavidus metallidurans]|uniref:hypothetical protein n=1 Tax=Cupriavidus TaxID=106589 RepID=UPI0025A6DB89|nr:hypothetical protein [Cupriavidus sp. TKC]GMG90266.1 hypothetical protein Cmtc_14860 [Cupriavidus sp. TKC]
MPTLATTLAVAPALLAPFVALGLGAYLIHRWMQRQAKTTAVSPDTMLDRVVRLIDTSALKSSEIELVRSLKERRNLSQVVNVTAAEFEMIKQIHGRLYR